MVTSSAWSILALVLRRFGWHVPVNALAQRLFNSLDAESATPRS